MAASGSVVYTFAASVVCISAAFVVYTFAAAAPRHKPFADSGAFLEEFRRQDYEQCSAIDVIVAIAARRDEPLHLEPASVAERYPSATLEPLRLCHLQHHCSQPYPSDLLSSGVVSLASEFDCIDPTARLRQANAPSKDSRSMVPPGRGAVHIFAASHPFELAW